MILVIVGLSRATGRHLDDELIIWMGRRLLSIFIVVTFYVLLIENAHRVYLAYSHEAGMFFLFGGIHSLMFWVGLIFVGSVVPAVLLFIKRTGTSVRWTVFASILVVVGVLFERFLIVIPGLIHPPSSSRAGRSPMRFSGRGSSPTPSVPWRSSRLWGSSGSSDLPLWWG